MRVRNKQCHADEYVLLEETANFYVAKKFSDHPEALPKTLYEPIPEETWRDVSHEVEIREDSHLKHHYVPGGVFHGAKHLAQLVCGGGYRLRRVDVYHSISSGFNGLRSAFIIEKKDA